MRPSSSSSPQSPHVEPSGRCFHRLRHALHCTDRSVLTWFAFTRSTFPAAEEVPTMTQKDFVVSADGHLLEPTDLFRTRLPKHLRDRGGVGGGLRDRAARRGRRPGLPPAAHARLRGLDDLPLPPDAAGARPRATPSSSSRTWTSTASTPRCMHPNLSLFGLYSDDHELSMAHARVYNDYVIERFAPYFDRLAPTAPDPAHRHRRRRRRDRAGRGRRLPGHPPARRPPPMPYYSRDLDPVWAAVQANGVQRVLPHPDRRREGRTTPSRPRSRS